VIRRVEAGEAPGARPDAPTHFVDLDNLPASREVDPERGGRNESRPAD